MDDGREIGLAVSTNTEHRVPNYAWAGAGGGTAARAPQPVFLGRLLRNYLGCTEYSYGVLVVLTTR